MRTLWRNIITGQRIWTHVEAIYKEICRIGHNGDFFSARILWWMRRAIGWLIGGPSFRRRRRHPEELRVGDVVRIALIALALALVSTLYPAWVAARTAPAEALRYD